MSFTDWLYSVIVKFFMFNKDIMRIEPKSTKNENFEKKNMILKYKMRIRNVFISINIEISQIYPYLLKESIIEPFVMSSIFRNCLSYS